MIVQELTREEVVYEGRYQGDHEEFEPGHARRGWIVTSMERIQIGRDDEIDGPNY